MEKTKVLERIRQTKIVPVVRVERFEDALRAVEAVRAGGIDIFEITMTVPRAVRVIEELSAQFGDEILLGAGTVLDAETAQNCISAGARFIVSPAIDLATIKLCQELETAIMPGALTPTEIRAAWTAGADAVKVFPANALGGATYIKSIKTVFPHIELLPTGGVNLETATAFLKAGAVAVGVGGELIAAKALRDGSTATITENTRKFVELIRKFVCQSKM